MRDKTKRRALSSVDVKTIPVSPETLKRSASEVFANPPKFPKMPAPPPKKG